MRLGKADPAPGRGAGPTENGGGYGAAVELERPASHQGRLGVFMEGEVVSDDDGFPVNAGRRAAAAPRGRRSRSVCIRSALALSRGFVWALVLLFTAVAGATAQEPPPFAPEPAQACEGKEPGESCWMEIADRPGCYLWNPNLAANETVSWSGDCSGGLAQGRGSRQWSYPDDEGNPLVGGGEGELRDGKPNGPWAHYDSDGGTAQGGYEAGDRAGPWTHVHADGTVFEGEWAGGRRQGRWASTYGDEVGGGLYIAGERQGRWKLLFAASDDKTVRGTAEGLYVAGKRNDLWVTRFDSGTIHESTYRDGVRHGRSVSRYASGAEHEGPYEDGKKHGYWSERTADGTERSGSYREGEKHGKWLSRDADGQSRTETHVDGKRNGPYTWHDESGELVEEGTWDGWTKVGNWKERNFLGGYDDGEYVAGERHGQWRIAGSDRTSEGHYEAGEKHGRWRTTYTDGRTEVGSYDNDVRIGEWNRTQRGGINPERAIFVDGKGEWKKHGRWIETSSGGVSSEGSYMNGEKHGQWVERRSYRGQLNVREGSYTNGQRQGHWVFLSPGRRVHTGRIRDLRSEGPYVDGEEHGYWIEQSDVWDRRGQYENGNRCGLWRHRSWDGTKRKQRHEPCGAPR